MINNVRKYLKITLSNKGLRSRMFKVLKLNDRREAVQLKQAKDLHRHLFKEAIQIVNKM